MHQAESVSWLSRVGARAANCVCARGTRRRNDPTVQRPGWVIDTLHVVVEASQCLVVGCATVQGRSETRCDTVMHCASPTYALQPAWHVMKGVV
jgi:hypothetical protein